jgi:peroxiredoxin family protein
MTEVASYADQFAKAEGEEDDSLERFLVILSKGSMQDAYAALVMANGAVMEGIETYMFFTFFGLDAITKDKQDALHIPTVGNPSMMRNVPTMVAGLPGMEAMATKMMRGKMEEHDIPPVSEFLDMIVAGGGTLYGCDLAVDMFELAPEELVDEVEDIITVGEMLELAGGERSQVVFV